MKYLKPFNEDILSDKFPEELQDFCETNLAYLIDEGVEIKVTTRSEGNQLVEILLLEQPKRWNEIKDYMIPFLVRLNNKYNINKQINNNTSDIRIYVVIGTRYIQTERDSTFPYKMELLINDDTDHTQLNTFKINQLRFYVNGYKQQPKKSFVSKIKSFFK